LTITQAVLRLFILTGITAMLGCQREVIFTPEYPAERSLTVSHFSAYSTKRAEEEKETQGTLFQTQFFWQFEKTGSGFSLIRTLDSINARGYHKNSMPRELEKKANLTLELGPDLIPNKIMGYDSLHQILSKLPQKEEWKKQLLKLSDTLKFQAEQRDLWRLFTFLPKGQPLKNKQTLNVDTLNQKLETFKVDSARFIGRQPRLKKTCLDYALDYHRSDSLVLMMEQFFSSTSANRKLKKLSWQAGKVTGHWIISVELDTGLPCLFSRSEVGEVTLTDAEKKNEVGVQLISYEEDVVQ